MKKNIGIIIFLITLGITFWRIYPLISGASENTDVVVIGGGASGMSAAIEASLSKKSVILLEKMPYLGGNTLRATGGINGVDTQQQQEMNIQDSLNLYVTDVLKAGHEVNNLQLIEILAKESSSAIKWLSELGADLSDVGLLAGHSVARTHRPTGGKPVGHEIVSVLKNQIQNSDIDLRLEHKAIKIKVDENGQATGVEVEDPSGKIYTINSKAVIIATGGFGGSPEDFVYYNKNLKGYKTTNSPSATGDFIDLVEALDVVLIDMSYIQTHPTVSPQFGILITEAIRGNGGILINNSGKRFADELMNRDYLSAELLSQDNKEVYLIFNEEIRQTLAASDDYIDMNIVLKAEDKKSLANLLRIDYIQLSQTINTYNEYVENQFDEEFGRQSLKVLFDQGPYYAVQVIPAVHYCMGGILIDDRTRVINSKGNAIQGLYAAGEATGGIHGLNRLGGNSLLDAIVFGRIAGREASNLVNN